METIRNEARLWIYNASWDDESSRRDAMVKYVEKRVLKLIDMTPRNVMMSRFLTLHVYLLVGLFSLSRHLATSWDLDHSLLRARGNPRLLAPNLSVCVAEILARLRK